MSSNLFDTENIASPTKYPNFVGDNDLIQSTSGRYLWSRFRDHKIHDRVRVYLGYLHDAHENTCFEVKIKTNLKIMIQQEKLTTDVDNC